MREKAPYLSSRRNHNTKPTKHCIVCHRPVVHHFGVAQHEHKNKRKHRYRFAMPSHSWSSFFMISACALPTLPVPMCARALELQLPCHTAAAARCTNTTNATNSGVCAAVLENALVLSCVSGERQTRLIERTKKHR